MTVASEITKLQTNLTNSYSACEEKGATMPAKQNFDNLPATIESIESGGGETILYNLSFLNILSPPDENGVVSPPTEPCSAIFTGVKELSAWCFKYKFNGLSDLVSASFPDLITVGIGALNYAFSDCEALEVLEFPKLEELKHNNALMQVAMGCTSLKTVDLSSLKTITSASALNSSFYGCTELETVNLSSLETISGASCMSSTFYNCSKLKTLDLSNLKTVGVGSAMGSFIKGTAIETLNLPELTTISAGSAMNSAFRYADNLKTVYFTKLENIKYTSALAYCFGACTALTDVYFNALNTESFGSYKNQFQNMLGSTGKTVTHTLHFPSNMEEKISSLTGYPNFGGTSGYVALAFDLPATS